MTPQSSFMVVAPLLPGKVAALRTLLATMNHCPGSVDPDNALVPFGRFDRLHFARFVVLEDVTAGDIALYGVKPADFPVYLAFLGDCDGSKQTFIDDLARRAGEGLRAIFSHCEGFDSGSDLGAWMLAHDKTAAAAYVNWIGRPVRQIVEERALRHFLSANVPRGGDGRANGDPQSIRKHLRDLVDAERNAGRLSLTDPEPTPLGWQVREWLHAVWVPLVLLAALPLMIVALPFLAWKLRRLETTDPEVVYRPPEAQLAKLRVLEDHDVTNQFTALGSVKPGRFRRYAVIVLLLLLDYSCRHIYNRGHLTRVQTIHFARWVLLDDKQRLMFASNYDGSLDSYMDDFINKVAWGLNLVFSNGVGYPRTSWLVVEGARNEQHFKNYLRRHELPTEVWYKAYPGLTAFDLATNTRIREGLEASSATDEQVREWLKLL
ncbi:hypothetical protein [Paraburkholderia sacchari]|uniref:hypothetical protein n=1 Tax=Paraburkholderia sacchari TaxID=159450 RepID=UPI003D977E02